MDCDYIGYRESTGWVDDARISPISDWHVRALLLSVGAVLGDFSALSGLRNSKSATVAKRIPAIFAKKYHRHVSALLYLILFGTFIYWSMAAYDLRGAILYTFHGQIVLLTILFSVVRVASGILMPEGSGSQNAALDVEHGGNSAPAHHHPAWNNADHRVIEVGSESAAKKKQSRNDVRDGSHRKETNCMQAILSGQGIPRSRWRSTRSLWTK